MKLTDLTENFRDKEPMKFDLPLGSDRLKWEVEELEFPLEVGNNVHVHWKSQNVTMNGKTLGIPKLFYSYIGSCVGTDVVDQNFFRRTNGNYGIHSSIYTSSHRP